MEVRLNTSTKLKKILSQIKINKREIYFSEIFDMDIAKQVLSYFWENYINPSLASLLLESETPKELFYKIKKTNCTPTKSLQLMGALAIIKSQGFRELQKLLPSRSYARIKTQISEIETDDNYLFDVFKKIQHSLIKMNPLKI